MTEERSRKISIPQERKASIGVEAVVARMAWKIAVCDDEPAQLELLSSLASRWGARRREAVEVRAFPSAEAFWFCWEEEKDWSALLLDIEMGGISGMELAKRLRAQGEALPIVFITGISEYLGEGYEVEALHYLLKPVEREKLFACLDRAVQKAGREPFVLVETGEGEAVRLLQKEIASVEAVGHTVRIRRGDGTVLEARMGFQAMKRQLAEESFTQCHRSYLVGLRHVARLGKSGLTLDDGSAVPVSRRLFPEVSRAFVAFYRLREAE